MAATVRPACRPTLGGGPGSRLYADRAGRGAPSIVGGSWGCRSRAHYHGSCIAGSPPCSSRTGRARRAEKLAGPTRRRDDCHADLGQNRLGWPSLPESPSSGRRGRLSSGIGGNPSVGARLSINGTWPSLRDDVIAAGVGSARERISSAAYPPGVDVTARERASGRPPRRDQEPTRPDEHPIEKHPMRQLTPEEAKRLGTGPVARMTRDGSRQLTPDQTRALGRRAIEPERSEAERERE